jgi:multisubunit Na+/H+ antiporter MnhG subunit
VIAVKLLLVLAVASAWLAAWGLVRLHTPFDRLHCVTFAAIACGLPIAAAVFAADGASDTAFKVLLLVLVMLVSGAVLAHATGRAIGYRGAAGEPE